MLRLIRAGTFFCLSFCGLAHAQYLVDTGTPTDPYPAYSLFALQTLGGSFTLSSAAALTSVEIYLAVVDSTGVTNMDLTVSLYDGDPGGAAHFEKSFDLAATSGWNALSGFSWGVDAGTYTVTFASSIMDLSPGASFPAPAPLPFWYLDPTGPFGWIESTDPGFGIRIGGMQVSPIPEPETYAMIAFGLAALGVAARRRRLPGYAAPGC